MCSTQPSKGTMIGPRELDQTLTAFQEGKVSEPQFLNSLLKATVYVWGSVVGRDSNDGMADEVVKLVPGQRVSINSAPLPDGTRALATFPSYEEFRAHVRPGEQYFLISMEDLIEFSGNEAVAILSRARKDVFVLSPEIIAELREGRAVAQASKPTGEMTASSAPNGNQDFSSLSPVPATQWSISLAPTYVRGHLKQPQGPSREALGFRVSLSNEASCHPIQVRAYLDTFSDCSISAIEGMVIPFLTAKLHEGWSPSENIGRPLVMPRQGCQ